MIHLAVISFNLFGWIWKSMRTYHLWAVALTLSSWLILGIKYGMGYCFLTDWHWDIKRKLGETDMPNSFVQYLIEKLGFEISPNITDQITLISFLVAIVISLYLNFFSRSKKVH